MKFETVFDKGDRVWYMKDNKPVEVVISCIEIFYVDTDQDKIKYNAGMEFAVDFLRNHHQVLDQKRCKSAKIITYETDKFRNAIKLTDNSVMYVGLYKGACLLFIYTGLDCNLFDLHLSKSVSDNINVFENDMMFITSKLHLFEDNALIEAISMTRKSETA